MRQSPAGGPDPGNNPATGRGQVQRRGLVTHPYRGQLFSPVGPEPAAILKPFPVVPPALATGAAHAINTSAGQGNLLMANSPVVTFAAEIVWVGSPYNQYLWRSLDPTSTNAFYIQVLATGAVQVGAPLTTGFVIATSLALLTPGARTTLHVTWSNTNGGQANPDRVDFHISQGGATSSTFVATTPTALLGNFSNLATASVLGNDYDTGETAFNGEIGWVYFNPAAFVGNPAAFYDPANVANDFAQAKGPNGQFPSGATPVVYFGPQQSVATWQTNPYPNLGTANGPTQWQGS